jgi:hypothetical protein
MNKITMLGRFRIPALILGVFVAPGIASAQALRCDSRVLQPDDEQQLITKAKEGLPRGLEPFMAHPCRNPGSAHAEVITEHVQANGGVNRWWEMQCQRDAKDWKCDPAEFKQFINARVVIDGRSRHLALSFDKDTTLNRAKNLSVQALRIYADPTSRLPDCSSGDDDWQHLRQSLPLPRERQPIQVTVTQDGGTESVMLEDIHIEIRLTTGVKDSGVPDCWNEWIVVT